METDFGVVQYPGVGEYDMNTERIIPGDGLLFRLIFENAAIGIALINLEGRLIETNPAFLKMFGYSEEEIHARFFGMLFHPGETQTGNCVFFDMPYNESDHYRIEKRFICKNGTVIWCWLTISLVRQSNLAPWFFVAMIEDITHRKQMEENLIAETDRLAVMLRSITGKQRMAEELIKHQRFESLSMLAGGIAHDFNNILAGILANAQLAKVLLSKGKDITGNLMEIAGAIKRASKLTKQLLNFAKCGSPVKKATSIVELIKTNAEFSLRGTNVKCRYNLPDSIWPVEGDEGQLSQVINNMIINAVQAMPEGGALEISAENMAMGTWKNNLPLPQKNYVKITLKDNGIGIPEDFLPKIFDPYFTTKERGSGLGLATSYSIIKKHDGYIGVESKPYVGTTFFIYLPASENGIVAKTSQPEKIFNGRGKILLMDDEATIRNTTKKLLTHLGYKAVIAKDGAEVLDLYKVAQKSGNPFDAVIMDLTVPGGGGGKETLRKLKKIDPKVKAILSSGYAYDGALTNFYRYGFKGVVIKPYNMEELSATLHQVIHGS